LPRARKANSGKKASHPATNLDMENDKMQAFFETLGKVCACMLMDMLVDGWSSI